MTNHDHPPASTPLNLFVISVFESLLACWVGGLIKTKRGN